MAKDIAPEIVNNVIARTVVTLTVTNTIVTGFSVGITAAIPASATIVADHVLFWNNDDDGVRGTNPVNGDPRFLNPAAGDFRLRWGSAAIDAGRDAGVTEDFEGQPRDSRPDIGADESGLWTTFVAAGAAVSGWSSGGTESVASSEGE